MSQSDNLRQKAIGVLYLTVLCLFFLYFSYDFSSSIFTSHKRLELDFLSLNAATDARIAGQARDWFAKDSLAAKRKMEEAAPVEASFRRTVGYIDTIETALQEQRGLNGSGYPRGGQSHVGTRRLMFGQHMADTLWVDLRDFYTLINQRDSLVIDSIVNSKGDKKAPAKFYFEQMPLNMSLLHLSTLKIALLRARAAYYERLFMDMPKAPLSPQSLATVHPRDAAGGKDTARAYMASMLQAVGSPVSIRLQRPPEPRKVVQVTVSRSGRELISTMSSLDQFTYTPPEAGIYDIKVTEARGRLMSQVQLAAWQPLILQPKLGTLFTDLDNELEIKNILSGEALSKLEFKVTGDGQVFMRGKNIYFRTSQKGPVTIAVYDGPGQDKPVYLQKFVVRELNPPVAFIEGSAGASTMPAAALSTKNALAAHSGEPMVNEAIYVSKFDFVFIPAPGQPQSFYYHNTGANFNANIQEVLSQARPGNVLLFTNIYTKSSLGAERSALSFIITVK